MESLTQKVSVFMQFLGLKEDEGVRVTSVTMKMHYIVTASLLLFGLLVTTGENYLDPGSIICREAVSSYATHFCFYHGTSFIHPIMRGKRTVYFFN